jgi:peptidylprolyl isomerase
VKKHSNRLSWLGFALILALALAACGSAQDSEQETAESTAVIEATAEPIEEPTETPQEATAEGPAAPSDFDIYDGHDPDEFTTTDSGLQYFIFEDGDGQTLEEGRIVRTHITGYLEDGTTIVDTRAQSAPAPIPADGQTGLLGLDEAMTFLTLGSKARLILPPELAFGDTGAQGVPPGSTIIFDVELVDLAPLPPEAPTAIDDEDYTVTDSGLKYYEIAKGDGPVLEEGQTALIDYTGWLEDGTMFDSSIPRGQPLPVPLGAGAMIPGFDEALLIDLRVGDVRQLVIPSDLAYGEQGRPGIPPNSVLIFEIEVVGAQ